MRIYELFDYSGPLDDLGAYIDLERIPPDLLDALSQSMARQEAPECDTDLLQIMYGDDLRDRVELDLLALDVRLRRAEIAAKIADAIKTHVEVLSGCTRGELEPTR